MKKSYISLALSGVLVGLCGAETVANFCDKNSAESCKGSYANAEVGTPAGNAVYGKDWTGSASSLSVQSDTLKFTFDSSNAPFNLIFGLSNQNNNSTYSNFYFYNSRADKANVNLTIAATNNPQSTLTFGAEKKDGGYTQTTLYDKNLKINLEGFSQVNVKGDLRIASQSSLKASDSALINDAQIRLDEKAELQVKTLNNQKDRAIFLSKGATLLSSEASTNDGGISLGVEAKFDAGSLTNQGVIAMAGSSTITAESITGDLGSSANLLVQGDSKIISATKTGDFSITGQWVELSSGANLAIEQSQPQQAKTITLGEAGKESKFQGKKFIAVDNKNLIEATPSPNDSLVSLIGFDTLQSQNLSLHNISLQAQNATTLKNSTLAMNNAYLFLGDNALKDDGTSKNFILSSDSSSSQFKITGINNAITAGKNTIDFKGTHQFQSIDDQGVFSSNQAALSLIASQITLGEAGTALKLSGDGFSTLALRAKQIAFENLNFQNLTLQIVGDNDSHQALIENKQMLLGNHAILKATDGQNHLIDLKIQNSDQNSIKVYQQGGSEATLWAKNILITDNQKSGNGWSDILIGYNNQKATLTLKAEESVTLGESGDAQVFRILGQNKNNLADNVLDLEAPVIHLGKNVSLDHLTIIAGSGDEGARIYGTQGGTIFLKQGTGISTGRMIDGQMKYSSLLFGVQKAEGEIVSSKMKFTDETTFSASNMSFEHQEITLNGNKNFSLYAYGENEKNKSGDVVGVGNFSFSKVEMIGKKGGTSELKLYGGVSEGDMLGGVSLRADDLTLSDVNLGAYQISKPTEKNSLEITSAHGALKTLGKVNIGANGIYTMISQPDSSLLKVQGIGGNLIVGDANRWGQLMIQSDVLSDEFVIGGNLTLDHSNAKSTFKVKLGANELQNYSLGLKILGGMTAIHSEQITETNMKAKSFEFGETSILTSKYGTLKLTQNTDKLDLKGKVILEGKNNPALEAKLAIEHKTPSTPIALTLHHLEAIGTASIAHSGITFANSNIIARGERIKDDEFQKSGGVLTITDSTSSRTQMQGTIASITLSGANLEFKAGSAPVTAGFNLHTLEKDKTPFIHSIGDSTLNTTLIRVGALDEKSNTSDENARFDLKVENGTFKLIETGDQNLETENKIRHITLSGGNFAFVKEMDGSDIKTYHSLKLQGDILSEGNSFINVASLEHSDKEGKISSTHGELGFYLMGGDLKDSLTFSNDFVLNNGSIAFYDQNSALLDGVILKQKEKDNTSTPNTITSVGNSALRAGSLELSGSNINASGGTLTLEGIETVANAGDIVVGDAGILHLKTRGGASLASLKAKSITLSSNAPYLLDPKMEKVWKKQCNSSSQTACLLGGGVFGKIEAESLILEAKEGSTNKLVNLQVKKAEPTNAIKSKEENPLDDSLFALREGAVTLIDTRSGIFKFIDSTQEKKNLTLEDVSIDKGGYTSLSLTPKLIEGEDWLGSKIVKALTLDISVSQTNLAGLLEGIADQASAQIMGKIFQDPINALIVESMLQSSDNALKVGMAEYISQGNVPVVSASLGRIRSAMVAMTEGIYASDKILQELKMLRTSNLQNRMVRSGNPYVSKIQIAHLLQSLKGVRYASEDDDLLLDEGYSGPNYGAVWASYEGATSFGEHQGASVNGLSAGYDTLVGEFKEYLLGFYANYGYGTYGSSFVNNESHNFGLGFYARMTFGSNEVDLSISQSVGLNTSRLMQNDPYPTTYPSYVANALRQDLKYNFYLTDAQMRYGYMIKVGDEESPFYFKPYGGLNFSFAANSEAKGEGVAPLSMDTATHFRLDVTLGLEMKKYFNEGSYIYLMPFLEKGLFNDGNIVNIGFVGANKIPYGQFYQVNTAVGIYAGGQGSVGENVSITGGVGLRMDIESGEYLTNWNVGFKYKF